MHAPSLLATLRDYPCTRCGQRVGELMAGCKLCTTCISDDTKDPQAR